MKMKKMLSLLLVLLMTVLAVAACGRGTDSDTGTDTDADTVAVEPLTEDSLKTIGDVIALENKGETQASVTNNKAVYAFKYGDTYYRVSADVPEDVEEAYFAVDIMQDDFEKQQEELIAPLEISSFEILSDQILSQEELDALKGRTGQELLDEGWIFSGSFSLDDMDFWMSCGPFEYKVRFDGSADGMNAEDYDAEAAIKDMKVRSAEFSSLSSGASDPE